MNSKVWNFVIIILFISSCSHNQKQQEEIVKSMVGHEIVIPDDLHFQILDTPFEYDFDDSDFKIITYIDSTGCTSCNMKLPSRNVSIDEFKSLEEVEVNYVLVINSKDTKEIIQLLRMGNFSHPVVIDTEGEFVKYNEMPVGSAYRTFLLDNSNRILALGDPVTNPKIKDLYKKIMTDNKIEDSGDKVSLVNKPVRNIGLINKGDSVKVSFSMFNRDSVTYHIQDIIPSCDCVAVETESSVLVPGGRNDIRFKFATDFVGSTFSKHIDIFYEENETPERLTVYGYLR